MKKKLLSLFFGLSSLLSFSQSDNCSTATVITPNAGCVNTAGTSAGATQSIPGCAGTADDDVWYQFTATATSHQITVTPSASYDPVVQLFSGGCAALANLYCEDLNNMGQSEVINATGLTIGAVYHFRIYDYWTGSGSSTFSVCVSAPPTPPVNDACASATLLTANSSCITTAGTSVGATLSYTSACGGTPDDDVWYTFVANSTQQIITVAPSPNMDVVVELLSGSCGAFTSLDCIDNNGTGGTESGTEANLTPGTTYYVRVYDYWSSNGGYPFTICITGAATTGDDPCNAFVLPPVTSDCNYISMSNSGFTSTSGALAPAPANCGGSGTHMGGFSATSHDVWFALTVPASGHIFVSAEPNLAGGITDGVMALYSGACGSLTQIACNDDDHSAHYPPKSDSSFIHYPCLSQTGLTPGTTVYIRYWGYGSNTGNFGLCVSSPTNDACSNALYLCDLNGYSSSTSSAYTPDWPCNMKGDAETTWNAGFTPPRYNYAPGSNSGGPFGQAPPFAGGVGSPAWDVQINNNSWIKFTAAATTASFSIAVGGCWIGSYPSGGLQMQIFSGTNCCAFSPVSDFKEGSSGFTITAQGLTAGQDYYLMVDGYAKDVCNYTVTANSGVQVPSISATPSTICFGDSTKLAIANASVGSTFLWFPGGQTTQSITVAPPTSMTYSCQISGVCGNKQTLSQAVTVNALPPVQINGAASQTLSICANTSTTLTASGGTTYTWSAGLSSTSGNTVTITPTSTTNATFTVTSTNASGCKSTATIHINGLALPSFSVTNAHPNTCNNLKDTLTIVPTPAGTYTYSWSTGAGTNSITPTITANTAFTATVTDVNNCKSTLTTSVSVLTVPAVGSNTATICAGQTATLTATGTASTFTWSPSATLSSANGASVTGTPTVPTNYTITGTAANGCVNSNTTTINVNPTPTVTVNSATVCAGTPVTLIAGGATSYTWSTGVSGTSTISVAPTVTTSYTVTGKNVSNNCTNTAVSTISVNPVPTLTAAPTTFTSNCGAVGTGSITGIGITAGSGSLSYTWTNGSNVVVGNSQDINNMPAGTYNVHVADANCSATFGPYSITNPGSPAAPSITTNTTTACVGQTITVSASSGTATPTYTWTGPGGFTTTNPSFTLSPTQANQTGNYAVVITLAGCTSSPATVSLTINPLPLVNAVPANNPYCAGATVDLNGSSATSYTWSGPGGYNSNVQNPQITNSTTLTTGIYTLTVTDANGCVNSDTAKVDVNVTPVITSYTTNAANNTICNGSTVQLNATVNPVSATLQWSGPNGYTVTAPPSPVITPSVTGTYTVIATVGACQSVGLDTVRVTVNQVPTVTASVNGSSTICSGNTISFLGNPSGYASYSWSGPLSYTSNLQNPQIVASTTLATGIYTLTVTDNGCSNQDTASVTVYQTPSITSYTTDAANNTICNGSNVQLIAAVNPPSATLQWSGPNGYTAAAPPNPVITPSVTGTYTVVATVMPGGCQNTGLDTVRVTVNQVPTVTASVNGSSTICSGNAINLLGNPSGYASYSWSGPLSYTSNLQNPQIANSTTGAYTFTLTVINNGCPGQDTANVFVNPTPSITSDTTDANKNTICLGQNIQLIATANPATAQIIWTGPNGFTATAPPNPVITPTVSGTYTVIAVTLPPAICQSTGVDTVHITVNPKPVATATNSTTNYTICSGNNVTLIGGANGNSYQWNGPGAYSSIAQSPQITNVQQAQTGTYTLTVSNSFSCTSSDTTSFNVGLTPLPAISSGNVKTCTGGALTVSATGAGTLNWYSGAALTNLVFTGTTFNPTVPSGTTNIYYVTVTSSSNCQSTTPTMVSVGNYNIHDTAIANVYSGNAPLTVNFSGQIFGATNPAYSWALGDAATSTLQNPSHTYNAGGDYIVTLISTDTVSHCPATATLTIHVIDEMIVVIPNIFTPNGDGINDGFFVTTTGVKSIEGFIMNRWGQLMFEWAGLNSVWNGTAPNGNAETEGTYFYVIKVTSFSNKTKEFKGPLTLIR